MCSLLTPHPAIISNASFKRLSRARCPARSQSAMSGELTARQVTMLAYVQAPEGYHTGSGNAVGCFPEGNANAPPPNRLRPAPLC